MIHGLCWLSLLIASTTCGQCAFSSLLCSVYWTLTKNILAFRKFQNWSISSFIDLCDSLVVQYVSHVNDPHCSGERVPTSYNKPIYLANLLVGVLGHPYLIAIMGSRVSLVIWICWWIEFYPDQRSIILTILILQLRITTNKGMRCGTRNFGSVVFSCFKTWWMGCQSRIGRPMLCCFACECTLLVFILKWQLCLRVVLRASARGYHNMSFSMEWYWLKLCHSLVL